MRIYTTDGMFYCFGSVRFKNAGLTITFLSYPSMQVVEVEASKVLNIEYRN